jgi:hypothetical protein
MRLPASRAGVFDASDCESVSAPDHGADHSPYGRSAARIRFHPRLSGDVRRSCMSHLRRRSATLAGEDVGKVEPRLKAGPICNEIACGGSKHSQAFRVVRSEANTDIVPAAVGLMPFCSTRCPLEGAPQLKTSTTRVLLAFRGRRRGLFAGAPPRSH